MRLATGHEALVARVTMDDGRVGFGFNFHLDSTAARHMAEWAAGARRERPTVEPALGHPWEMAFVAQQNIDWSVEPAFAKLRWLPEEERHG